MVFGAERGNFFYFCKKSGFAKDESGDVFLKRSSLVLWDDGSEFYLHALSGFYSSQTVIYL